ncbi:hypothetical protein [Peptoniphilus sp.]|uniref:hypothetical protein n=1 Tax=Peptoniphilus sp. TaxID=1971214 RepID=UPI003D944D3E
MKKIKKSLNSMTNSFHKSFAFLKSKDLPNKNYISKTLDGVDKMNWITTGQTNLYAKNHCAAVAETNMFLYYNRENSNDKIKIFKKVHEIVGNGPVFSIDTSAKKFFKANGYSLFSKKVNNISNYKEEIENGHIVAILIAKGIVNWHWILGVGFREYEDGNFYAQIIDGWNNTSDKFYKLNNDKSWISARSFVKNPND